MTYKILPLIFLFLMSFVSKDTYLSNNKKSKHINNVDLPEKITTVYESLITNNFSLPQLDSFKKAAEGYFSLKQKGIIQKDILTLIDFGMPSSQKRLWVINLATKTVLFNTYVSHGINSGEVYANSFSNDINSNKSSLGLYLTGETYFGKHGISLKLDGLEKGVNNNARSRSVVIHGANYANPDILKTQNYLGRSQGCPAIPQEDKIQIINTIKCKSCLFIYHPIRNYNAAYRLITQL